MVATQDQRDAARAAIEQLQQLFLTDSPAPDVDRIAQAVALLQRLGEQLLVSQGL